ncbi:hypothetical protein SDC9_173391 [bioreactor metagenome]|uniref:Uncharacterized protein n=1 Tax=bioreactor metagenome TaxID=1076179 RepID=A0A645GJG4_9ZZZZ
MPTLPLNLFFGELAHDASRLHEKDHDKNDKANRITKGGVDRGSEDFGDAHDEAAEHCATNIANAAENGRDERLCAKPGAHIDLNLRIDARVADSRYRGERAANEKCNRDDAVYVDSHQRRSILVHADRAHLRAHLGLVDQQIEPDHNHRGKRNHDDLRGGDRCAEESVADRLEQRWERTRIRPDKGQRAGEILQKHGNANRRDQRDHARLVAQRPVGHRLDANADCAGAEHGD